MGMHCCQSRHLPYCTSLVERPSLSIKHFCSSDSRPESYSLSIYLSLFLFFSFIYLSFCQSLSLFLCLYPFFMPFLFLSLSLSHSLRHPLLWQHLLCGVPNHRHTPDDQSSGHESNRTDSHQEYDHQWCILLRYSCINGGT